MPPLYGTCPECGSKGALSSFAQGPDAGRVMEAQITRLPNVVATRLIGYLKLHAPKGRALNWGKALRLIEELADLVAAPSVVWERQTRPAEPKIWAAAMDEAANAAERSELDLPLDNHKWLRKVAWSKAGKAQAAGEREQAARARGETPLGYSAAHRPLTGADEAQDRDITLRNLMQERNTLLRLERATPGLHTDAIAKIEDRINAVRCIQTTDNGDAS